MTDRLPLFDLPASRATDPPESRQAEREITEDGTRARMLRYALNCVRLNPGLTSNELEELHSVYDGRIRKRLAELETLGAIRRGDVRKSSVTGKANVTWWPL